MKRDDIKQCLRLVKSGECTIDDIASQIITDKNDCKINWLAIGMGVGSLVAIFLTDFITNA